MPRPIASARRSGDSSAEVTLLVRTSVAQLRALLPSAERAAFVRLMCAMVIMAAVEALGVFSVMPFMVLVANPQATQGQFFVGQLHRWLQPASPEAFVFMAGIVTLALLALGNLVAAATTWRILRFSYRQEHELSQRLLASY